MRESSSALLGGLPRDLVGGQACDLLAPLRFLVPGESPTAPSGTPPAVERAELARALGVANRSYGHPRADELAAKLAEPSTAVVITGQQTGLFGGPLLTLVKAAAAVRWAEAIEAAGRPAVALFWMATEDHDWAEIAELTVPGANGAHRVSLGDDPQPLAPIGLRAIGGAVDAIVAELAALQASPGYRSWLEELALLWRPEARFGAAFAGQMTRTLGARAPLLVDALLPELKRAEAPHLARLIERRGEAARRQESADAALAARGYALQVHPQPGASALFLLRGHERRRIEWRGDDRFALRGVAGEHPVSELLAALANDPALVSPGVLARPAIQDAVFGTTLQVVGPGELSYLPQVAPVYELLGITAPFVALRPQAVVLDARQARRPEELGIVLAELVADPAAVERQLGERSGGDFVAPVKAEIEARIEALRAPAAALDPSLEKPHAKTRETILHALEMFAAKVVAAAARKDETARARFEQLREVVRPGGKAQERVIGWAHFVGRFGPAFGAALLDQLELDPRRLSVIVPPASVDAEPQRAPESPQ